MSVYIYITRNIRQSTISKNTDFKHKLDKSRNNAGTAPDALYVDKLKVLNR